MKHPLGKILEEASHFTLAEDIKDVKFDADSLVILKSYIGDWRYDMMCLYCIAKMGPPALSYDPDPCGKDGVVTKICAIDRQSNCLHACLDTLNKIGYRDESIVEHIRTYLDPEFTFTIVEAIKLLIEIKTKKSIDYLQELSLKYLLEFNKKDQKKVIEILRKSGYTEEIVLPESSGGWYKFTTLEISSGKIWAGDPQYGIADDGCVIDVEPGTYVVECDGVPYRCSAVTKLRVRLESVAKPKKGKKVGETVTDSCAMGVSDVQTLTKLENDDFWPNGFGIVTAPNQPLAAMPFVPMGSDGGGPVYALMSGKRVVGIQLPFTGEE